MEKETKKPVESDVEQKKQAEEPAVDLKSEPFRGPVSDEDVKQLLRLMV